MQPLLVQVFEIEVGNKEFLPIFWLCRLTCVNTIIITILYTLWNVAVTLSHLHFAGLSYAD